MIAGPRSTYRPLANGLLSGSIAAAAAWFGAHLSSAGDPAAVLVLSVVVVLGPAAMTSALVLLLGRSDGVTADDAVIRVSALRTWPSALPLLLWRVRATIPWSELRSIQLLSGVSASLELTGSSGSSVKVCSGVLDCSPYTIADRLRRAAARRNRGDLAPRSVARVFERSGRRRWFSMGGALLAGSTSLLACLIAGASRVEPSPVQVRVALELIAIPFVMAAAAFALGSRPQERLVVDGLGITLERGSSCDHVAWSDLHDTPLVRQTTGGLKHLVVVGRRPWHRIEWTTLGPGAEDELDRLEAAIREGLPA